MSKEISVDEMKNCVDLAKGYEHLLDEKTRNKINYIDGMTSDNVIIRILMVHITSEFYINKIIENRFVNYKQIFDDPNFTYASKLRMIYGIRLIPEYIYQNLHKLNHIRNGYAHNLNLKINPFHYTGYSRQEYNDNEVYKIVEIKQQNFQNKKEQDDFIKDFCATVLKVFLDYIKNDLQINIPDDEFWQKSKTV
jgi:hypothetical protein